MSETTAQTDAGGAVGTELARPDPSTRNYSETVNISWGMTLTLLIVLVAVTIWKGARVKRELAEQEEHMGRKKHD